jgi:hypothetical protein
MWLLGCFCRIIPPSSWSCEESVVLYGIPHRFYEVFAFHRSLWWRNVPPLDYRRSFRPNVIDQEQEEVVSCSMHAIINSIFDGKVRPKSCVTSRKNSVPFSLFFSNFIACCWLLFWGDVPLWNSACKNWSRILDSASSYASFRTTSS